MDPSSRSSLGKRSRRDSQSRRPTPGLTTEERSRGNTSHQSSSHSLPSIRQLHPYLPLSSMSQQHIPGSSEGGSYSYPPPPTQGYTVASSSNVPMTSHDPSQINMPGQTQETHRPTRGDSDHEGDDPSGPPKKKRRRQALSCTG